MHWTLETLENVLILYKEQRLLWDNKHHYHMNKESRDRAFEYIAKQLRLPNLTGQDINRKLKAMRSVYQVELRNINTAKLRGFFYNPTLKWFNAYKNTMDDIEALKSSVPHNPKLTRATEEDSGDEIVLQEEESNPNTYLLKIKQKEYNVKPDNSSHAQIILPSQAGGNTPELVLEESTERFSPVNDHIFSDDSDDEFQLFADHIAEQMRTMSSQRTLLIRNQIQRIFDKDRQFNGLPSGVMVMQKSSN